MGGVRVRGVRGGKSRGGLMRWERRFLWWGESWGCVVVRWVVRVVVRVWSWCLRDVVCWVIGCVILWVFKVSGLCRECCRLVKWVLRMLWVEGGGCLSLLWKWVGICKRLVIEGGV